MALFTAADLTTYLHYEVPADQAASAEKVASGWLLGRVGIAAWPEWPGGEVPAQLWSLAVQLGAIIHENPTALASEGLGAGATSWSRRQAEIGEEVRSWARLAGLLGDASAAPGPRWSAPPAQAWPELGMPLGARSTALGDVRW